MRESTSVSPLRVLAADAFMDDAIEADVLPR